MRIAVLDVGSNTVHLLVVDAHRGAAPLPAYSHKETLRLAEYLDADGVVPEGVDTLVRFVRDAIRVADDKGCESVLAFATSAVREAGNSADVIARVNAETGVDLRALPGSDEARLTFLAVRRWFGWSSGQLTVFDIGGGSLEIASGADETPAVGQSLPLGAGRLTRDWLPAEARGEVPAADDVRALRHHIRTAVAREAGSVLRHGRPDHAVATSKTFRSLARVCGAAPSGEGPYVRRLLPRDELATWLPKLARMPAAERARLPGVSAARAHQLVAGALVADAVLDLFDLPELEICPWALREGVILEHLDKL
ncbi:MAG: Ppx/GppA family phosphatase [Actinomycetota bacterium]|nr:Ppx/GppA family phosphatase [Actinomycetota bacterium]